MKTILFLLSFLPLMAADRQMPPKSSPGFIDPLGDPKNACVPNYDLKVRPPSSYTTKLKIQMMAQLGLKGEPAAYEQDHRVPLILMGDPRDPRNEWPQPWPEAHLKDRLEVAVHRDYCAGKITLKQAQGIFLGNFWVEYDRRFGGK